MVIGGAADLRNTEKANQFLLSHDNGAWAESTGRFWQDGCQLSLLLCAVHSGSLSVFCGVSTGIEGDCRERKAEFHAALNMEKVLPAKER